MKADGKNAGFQVGDKVQRKGGTMIGEVLRVTPNIRDYLMSDGVSRAQARVRWSNGYEFLVPEGQLMRAEIPPSIK